MSGTATENAPAPAPVDPAPTPAPAPAPAPAPTDAPTEPGTALTAGKTEGVEGKPDDAPKSDQAPVAPESYDIKAPEGVELDPVVVESFVGEVAKAHNLTNAQAQAVIDFGLKREAAQTKAQQEQVVREEKEALDLLRKDPELGGANYEQTLKNASTAFRKFATPEEIEFMDATRLGNRVPMIKLFHRIYLAFREDAGGASLPGGAGTPKTEEDILRERYPSMFKSETTQE